MMQQWIGLVLFAAAPGATPAQPACPDVRHVPDADVAHVPEANLDPWLDPATAELVAEPAPRIERRVGDKGVRVDIPVPESLAKTPPARCPD